MLMMVVFVFIFRSVAIAFAVIVKIHMNPELAAIRTFLARALMLLSLPAVTFA